MAKTIEQRNEDYDPEALHRASLTAEGNRMHARLMLFDALNHGRDTSKIFPLYKNHENDIVPKSVELWAIRIQQDIAETKATTLERIFEKDRGIAKRYQNGEVEKRWTKSKS